MDWNIMVNKGQRKEMGRFNSRTQLPLVMSQADLHMAERIFTAIMDGMGAKVPRSLRPGPFSDLIAITSLRIGQVS